MAPAPPAGRHRRGLLEARGTPPGQRL